jgi:hypothetical protein
LNLKRERLLLLLLVSLPLPTSGGESRCWYHEHHSLNKMSLTYGILAGLLHDLTEVWTTAMNALISIKGKRTLNKKSERSKKSSE